jgi:hypothetical protein
MLEPEAQILPDTGRHENTPLVFSAAEKNISYILIVGDDVSYSDKYLLGILRDHRKKGKVSSS